MLIFIFLVEIFPYKYVFPCFPTSEGRDSHRSKFFFFVAFLHDY